MINYKTISNYQDDDGNLVLPNPRRYLDSGADEFNRLSLEQKLCNLGYLITHGFKWLEAVIDYCDAQPVYIFDALKPTLIYYIQMIRWGEGIHVTDLVLEEMTELELVILLEEEIKLRYQCWEGAEVEEFCFSNWDESILEEICRRAGDDKDEFYRILTTIDFSVEFKNTRKL